MRIICPDCGAQYEVPMLRLPSDKRVRCAQCGAEWRVGPASSTDEHDPAASLRRGWSERKLPAGVLARLDRGGWGPKLGWVLSILALLITGMAIFHWRADVVRIWPPSSRILAHSRSGPGAMTSIAVRFSSTGPAAMAQPYSGNDRFTD